VFGVTHLARVLTSRIAACTYHTITDVVIVLAVAAVFSRYDWNFHILQLVWEKNFFLDLEGKDTDSVILLKLFCCQLSYHIIYMRKVTPFSFHLSAFVCLLLSGFLCNSSSGEKWWRVDG
jgi:hypothetical protein